MNKLHPLRYPVEVFERAPHAHRVQYVLIGTHWNDLIILSKQLMLARASAITGPIHERHAQLAIELLNLRHLVGRLYEGEAVFRNLKRALPEWKDALSSEGVAAIQHASRYLAGNSVLKEVRNKIGFHQDSDVLAAAARTCPEDEFVDYIGETLANTLFMSAEAMQLSALKHVVGTATSEEALTSVLADTESLMTWTYAGCQAYHEWFLETHLAQGSALDTIELRKAPFPHKGGMPFFTRYRETLVQDRRSPRPLPA